MTVRVVLGMIVGATMWLGQDDPKPNPLSTFVPQPPAAVAQPQLEDQVPPLPGKQLHLRKSTDPGAARAVAGASDPLSPKQRFGPPMEGGVQGPPAPIEHPPPEVEEDS